YQTFEMFQSLADGPDILLPTEIWHGLYDGGHAAGLEDYWKVMYDKPLSAGFFLWVFSDEGVVRTDQNGRIDTDGNHAPDGIVGPHREKEGSFFALKEILSPVYISLNEIDATFDGTFPVQNRFDFTNLNQCTFEYWLADFPMPDESETGHRIVKKSAIESPNIAAHKKGKLKLRLPQDFRNHDALFLRAVDPFGNEIITRSFPIKKAADFASKIIKPSENKAMGSAENGMISVASGKLNIQFDNNRGMLWQVSYGGTDISLKNGPRLTAGGARTSTVKHYQQANDYVIEVTYVSGNFKYHKWTVMGSGWVKLEYGFEVYGYFDTVGITFNYPKDKVLGKKWLGDGPYRVWKNRQTGAMMNVWQNDYNNTITGVTYDYPEFKGYFSDINWLVLQTEEVPITILSATDNLYLHAFTPDAPEDARFARAVFPNGDISILHGIAPIGTKFHAADNIGPSGAKNHAAGLYEATLYFNFGILIK
ncbi:glycoside hydrolase family 2, partial [candidate division KSB1 bacterium]|nr:glycoside hydrolase family 2 [candidate division KSB1 bacterium]